VIIAGLQAGETVVADGLQRVRPGATVNPVPFGAPPPAPGGPAAGAAPANRG
jgi:membrane fusion protein (multidrug efflux system)